MRNGVVAVLLVVAILAGAAASYLIGTSHPSGNASTRQYQLEFIQESNCPYGSWLVPWAVVLSGHTEVQPSNATLPLSYGGTHLTSDSNYSTIRFSVLNGTYDYTVLPKNFLGEEQNGTVTVGGGNVQVQIYTFVTSMGCSSTTTTEAQTTTSTLTVTYTTTQISTTTSLVRSLSGPLVILGASISHDLPQKALAFSYSKNGLNSSSYVAIENNGTGTVTFTQLVLLLEYGNGVYTGTFNLLSYSLEPKALLFLEISSLPLAAYAGEGFTVSVGFDHTSTQPFTNTFY